MHRGRKTMRGIHQPVMTYSGALQAWAGEEIVTSRLALNIPLRDINYKLEQK